MAWNDCRYITQSNSNEATQINYQSAYAQCVSEVNMSGSIYVTEESQHKLYINSGSQSGSLIYTSENHNLDSEEVGVSSTGSFCHRCNAYFSHNGKEGMLHVNKFTGIGIPRWEFEISASQYNWETNGMFITDDYDVWSDDGTKLLRKVTSGSNLDMALEFWTD